MGQFLYKFIHVVLPGSIQSPLAEGTRGQSARPQDLQLHQGRRTIEFSSMSFFLCCTLTCRSSRPAYPSSRSTAISGSRSPTPMRLGGGLLAVRSGWASSGSGTRIFAGWSPSWSMPKRMFLILILRLLSRGSSSSSPGMRGQVLMRWLRWKNIVTDYLQQQWCPPRQGRAITMSFFITGGSAVVVVAAVRGVGGGLRHEVPVFVEDGLDVLSLAGEFTFVGWVCEDAAVGEDDVLADLGDFCLNLHLLAHLHHVEELSGERDGDGAHVGHPQHADCRHHVDHRRQSPPVNCLLDVLLVPSEVVPEGCESWVILVPVQRHHSPSEVLPEPAHEVGVRTVELQDFLGRQYCLHVYLYILGGWTGEVEAINSQMSYGLQFRDYLAILYISMQQQLFVNTIQIVPATMDDVLHRLQGLLSTPTIEEALLANIVKSLFFGLWNFDKMINQHNLSTRIAELLLKVPRKNALLLLKALLVHLHEKWNLIDHHRINKFMQLVRYLLVHAFKFCEKHKVSRRKIDEILLETVYDEKLIQNGLVFHVTDIYFQLCDETLPNGVTLEELKLYEDLLLRQSSEHLRLYIIEHVFEKYKEKMVQVEQEPEKLEAKVQEFAGHFLELARKEERELHRKNLYSIVGYAKSEHVSFGFYMQQKQLKAKLEQEKKKKKLTKGKKKEVKDLKSKRKEKKKKGKRITKIMSVRKFNDKKGKFKKGIEEL